MRQKELEVSEAMAAVVNVTPYRVIYGDTDQMGVVYYANYLRWFERGRSEFLRQMGTPYGTIEGRGIHFPVTEVSCRYLNSARYDDQIAIETRLTSVKRATLTFSYRILNEADDSLLSVGTTRHACVDGQGRVVKIPVNLRGQLEKACTPETTPKQDRA
jgi:acyl-CoA thioester hydrolase